MKIAFASSEAFPFAKTGGLGDVVGALPKAIENLGCEVKVFVPKYAVIDHAKYDLSYSYAIGEMPIRVDGHVHNTHVFVSKLPHSEVEIYFIDCPHYFNRPDIYTSDSDEDERFILFSKAVIESLQRLQWKPDVLHCNDWQTGLIPLYIKDNYNWDTHFFGQTASVMTIHNMAYQGRFPKATIRKAEIRKDLFYQNSPVEVWGSVSFLKAGLMYADVINTVSKTYAREITTSDYGAGLEDVLRQRINDFYGIVNGVDYEVWDPATDKHLLHHYSNDDLAGKLKNKQFLHDTMHLKYGAHRPLIGIISRLVYLKGFDLIAESIPELMKFDANWVILGSGEDKYENLFRSLAYVFPGKVSAYIGFNNELSHLIEAASDIFLMPSRFEPCGLNQIYSLKYGTVPIVRKTGGLADTVKDWDEASYHGKDTGTGFSFVDYTPDALISSVKRALECYKYPHVWDKIQQNGMNKNFSWEESGKQYIELYKKARLNRKNNS
ncbi:MAG: glycogen synthase GlgA [Ignavibacteriales bacterium]|nr:glycogen synthase GlgA [Ignavibacteriales bacterium]